MRTRLAPWIPFLALAALLSPPRNAAAQGGALEGLEKAIVRLAETVGKSVLSVEAVNRLSAPPEAPKGEDPEAVRAYLAAWERRLLLSGAWGSGYAIDETHAVTTAQVVPQGVSRVRVILPGGAVRDARVAGRSDADRVVLLEVEGGGLVPLRHASAMPALGEWVMTVGNTFEITQRMGRLNFSVGVVSGLYSLDKGYDVFYAGPVIETDAAVNPGNWGGPLVNRRGEAVGMVVSSFSFRRWLGCAIPADRVRKGLDRIAGKEPAPGAGEGAFDVASIGAALEEKDEAWTVRSVTPGGVADRLGWKPGDRIVRVGREAPAGGEGGARKAFRPGAKVAVVLDKANWRVGFEFQVPEGAGAKKGDDSEF